MASVAPPTSKTFTIKNESTDGGVLIVTGLAKGTNPAAPGMPRIFEVPMIHHRLSSPDSTRSGCRVEADHGAVQPGRTDLVLRFDSVLP